MSCRSIVTATEIETMETATEKKVRDLKARIQNERNPLRKSNLRFQLQGLLRELGAKHEAQQVRRFAGNQF